MQLEPADLESLLAWAVRTGGGSVDLDQLVRRAAQIVLERGARVRCYAPGATYAAGERIHYHDQVAEVVAVHPRGNPGQGSFSVLELRTGEVILRAVSEVSGAPSISDTPENSGEALAAFQREHGGELRTAVGLHPVLAGLVSVPERDVALSAPRTQVSQTPVRASTLFRADVFSPEVADNSMGAGAAIALAGVSPVSRAARIPEAPEDARLNAGSARWGVEHEGPDAQLRSVYEVMRSCFAGAFGGFGKGQTWSRFVAPAISSLGWVYAPLPGVSSPSGGSEFALFADVASRDRARSRTQSGVPVTSDALAVLVVEDWEQPLGRDATPYDASTSGSQGSPALRLVGHLLSEGVPWGILTNGREWRLYSSAWGDPDVGSTLGTFHAVDLSGIFGSSSGAEGAMDPPQTAGVPWQRFRQWAAVFGPEASEPDAYGRSIIDGLKRESSAYARAVVHDVRRRLLDTVLPEIAGGFVVYRAVERGAGTETDETLEEIVRASLGLVYRLLFVLHAEQHAVLPMGNPDYRGQSLTTMVRWARDCVADGPLPSAATHFTPRYDGLLTLFRHIDHGHPLLGLAEGGGEVFSPANSEYSFLERHRLSDRVVARTLAALGTANGEPVDYSVISMRHLSAVAEGLIESLLWVVEPAAGQVVLVSNSGAPQTSSSLPLPDFVGVSLIEAAVKAALAPRSARFATAMDRIAILHRGESEPVRTGVRLPEPVTTDRIGERVALAAAEQAARDALLGIKVLDPAMGTGTLLIGAIDMLVDGIAETLAAYHRAHPWVPWAWNPVARAIAETRDRILAAAGAQGVVIPPESLEDDVVLSRLVAERAIYGVDLNQTAVALARTSVATRAYAAGAPFVDVVHHLRRGDSLLGARLADVQDEALAPSLVAGLLPSDVALPPSLAAEGDAAMPTLNRPGALDGASDTTPLELLLDLWVSEELGNPGARGLLNRLGDDAVPALQGAIALEPGDLAIVDQARELAAALGFLHWDVAFPEVFLKPTGGGTERPGFDAIIGSPPAVSSAGASERGEDGPFMARARQLVRRPGGRVAFVVTPVVRAGRNRNAGQH